MTLTPGYYKTRDGRKARVLCVDAPGEYPCVGYVMDGKSLDPITWTDTGSFNTEPCFHSLDLIEPWTEPKPKKKRIELRRALLCCVVPPMSRSESVTNEYYRAEWVSLNHEHDISFVRWLDEEPLIVEIDE